MNVLLLFEQSGTFKHVLQKRGHNAVDVDIDNMFGETDIRNDIFATLLDTAPVWFGDYDLVIAFFPCTWFSAQNDLLINGTSYSMRNWTDEQKYAYSIKRLSERDRARKVLELLVYYCNTQNVPLIIENPAGSYIKSILGEPTVKHKRGIYGDWYNKSTYWYIYNCRFDSSKLKRYDNTVRSSIVKQFHHSDKERKINRSLISPLYAENFINCIVLGGDI